MPQAQLLRSRLEKPGVILLPGVFDCIGAMLCEKLGFDAIYTSGFSIAGSALGMPDIGLLTASENVEIIGRIANSVKIPVVADCDTGYGGPMNVYRLVTDLARQNVAAICLEDQQWPKKCGHFEGKRVVSIEEHVAKIKAACEARGDSGMVIIARTDSRAVLGLKEAVRRARVYYKAGADVVFVEATQSMEELKLVSEELSGVPLLSNYIEGGKTPVTNADHLYEIGQNYRFLMFSVSGLLASARALANVYGYIKEHGTTKGKDDIEHMLPFPAFKSLIGLNTTTEMTKRLEIGAAKTVEEDLIEMSSRSSTSPSPSPSLSSQRKVNQTCTAGTTPTELESADISPPLKTA